MNLDEKHRPGKIFSVLHTPYDDSHPYVILTRILFNLHATAHNGYGFLTAGRPGAVPL